MPLGVDLDLFSPRRADHGLRADLGVPGHPLLVHCGMPGMHGSVAAVAALQKSDLLITLGARFDDRVTGQLDSFAPGASSPTSPAAAPPPVSNPLPPWPR